jgi:arginase
MPTQPGVTYMKNLAKSAAEQESLALRDLAEQADKRTKGKQPKIDSVTLIYVPMYLGGCHRGASMGPAAMRVAELAENLEGMGLKIHKEVEIPVPHSVSWHAPRVGSEPKRLQQVLEVSEQLAEAVEQAMQQNTLALTIGGDHSLAIGSLAGVSSYYRKQQENFGLLWFDAHGDINTPETSPSGNIHGMPVAVALGKGDANLTGLRGFSPKVDARRTVLLGTRELDHGERVHIKETGVTAFTMRDIDRLGLARITDLALNTVGADVSGLHVSFDLDVMDPDVAPGVCLPARGGLTYREAALALTLVAETELVRSIDMVELNPAGDVHNKSAILAVDLLKAALGDRIL